MTMLKENVNTTISPLSIWYTETWVYIRLVLAKIVAITSNRAGMHTETGLNLEVD